MCSSVTKINNNFEKLAITKHRPNRYQPYFKLYISLHACVPTALPNNNLFLASDEHVYSFAFALSRHLQVALRNYLGLWKGFIHRLDARSYGRRTFAVAGPTAWNSLSDDLHDPTLSTDSFRGLLKTRLFLEY